MDEAYLEVRRDGGAEFVGLTGDRLTLGRAPANTVSFPSDDTVSRQHAVLERVPTGWTLRDIGSSNGTYVNGAKLITERLLRPGDEISLGNNWIVFRVGDPEAATDSISVVQEAGPPGSFSPGSEQSRPATAESEGYLDVSEEWGGERAPRPSTPPVARSRETVEAHSPGAARSPSSDVAPELATPAPPVPLATRPGRGSGHVRGVARGIQIRKTEDQQDLLAFRVDRYDGSGNRLHPVAVELRGYRMGHLSEGEEVEVTGKWSHGTLRATRIVNLSTNADIRGPSKASRVVLFFVYMMFLGWFAFIAYLIIFK